MITKADIKSYKEPVLFKNDNNIVISPNKLLRPFIANYTFACPEDMPDEMKVLPSLSTTLVYTMHNAGITGGLRGVSTAPVMIGTYARQFQAMVLVEFHSGGLYHFTGIDQSELLNQGFSFGDISPSIDREIINLLYCTNSIGAIKEQLDAIFASHLKCDAINPALALSIKQIISNRGILRCSQLSKEVHYSERQLNRLFNTYIGAGMKTFSRIVRIKSSIDLIAASSMEISRISETMGYYDPSHFVKDFKEICAVTPGELKSRMSLFYNDPFKLN